MNLFIDAGNTTAKWQLCDAGKILSAGRFDYSDVEASINKLLVKSVDEVWVAEVGAGQVCQKIESVFSGKCHRIISERECLGLINSYNEPERLGVDRFLALAEGFHLSGEKACCVIDVGTAATIDVVDSLGMHQGGHIVPGLNMLRGVLQVQTDKVRFEFEGSLDTSLGKSTGAAVENGCWSMMLAWVKQEVGNFNEVYPGAPVYVAGALGGELVNSLPSYGLEIEQDLVINALKRLSERSKV